MPVPVLARARSAPFSPAGHNFVDANHYVNVVTRSSHTYFLIYAMNMTIVCFSKKHNTVKISTFVSEFVEMRIMRDLIVALHYKKRMFVIPLDGTSDVMCDNQ